MAEVPSITLTDPNNLDALPSPAQSPTRNNHDYGDFHNRVARPDTPSNGAKSANGRPDSSAAWPSPGRLIRTLSGNSPQGNSDGSRDELHGRPDSSSAIDPLSQHIINRTHSPLNPSTSNNARPRSSDDANTQKDENQQPRDQNPAPAVQEPISRTETLESLSPAAKELKKGVKAVSFLSRLMGNAKKNREAEEEEDGDDNSTTSDRPEGNDAEVFTQNVDNMGFSPRHPQPPKYIKVRSKFKKEKDFDRLFLAQELHSSTNKSHLERQTSSNKLRRKNSANPSDANTIWAMEFSKDGRYLATAGVDTIVRVWAVLSSSEDRQMHEQQEASESEANGVDPHSQHLSAPVFQSKPVREYEGHTSTVLDLSWSKNNFLLSSSMDKTVRLWHATRNECLCTFKHNDFVPSIAFHPKDDRFFLAGSLDSKLRLWSIPDKSVAYAAQVPDMITAVAFTPDGKFAMAGCLSGLCMFYETEGLKYQTQIHVRSTRGQNAKGSKITGIQAQYGASGDIKVLITSNDSRIRLYNFRDKSLELKFKGNENTCSQIRAALSDDGRYIVCGSEDRKAYIWSMDQTLVERRDRTPVEMFEAHDTITTAVCLASMKTRQHLGRSEDPVYDLCNPPPVTLLSHAERAESQVSGSIQGTPPDAEGRFERPREPASYVARASHKEGNILVTADFTGKIKVFRQDCAWSKRARDDWDKASIFSKRNSRLSRTASVATRTSQKSLRDASRNSNSTKAASDRIASWRQAVGRSGSGSSTTKDTSRSISPRKSLEQRGRREVKAGSLRSTHPLATDQLVRSPSPMDRTIVNESEPPPPHTQSLPAKLQQEDQNPLALEGGRSYVFWDSKLWRNQADRMHQMASSHHRTPTPSPGPSENGEDHNHLAVRPPLNQVPTYVSELSDEQSSVDEFDDAREHGEDDMKCESCGGVSFSARRAKEGTRLVCTKCGQDA